MGTPLPPPKRGRSPLPNFRPISIVAKRLDASRCHLVCPQFGMPAERRAKFRVLNVPRSRISERAQFRIYEHAQCRVFERAICSAPMSYLAGSKWGRPLCYGHAAARWCLQVGCRVQIFKKASRGPSAADLHHYGRGQTRSE